MVAALWLLVLSVVGAAPGDPTAASLEATLREALVGIARVVVAPNFPADPSETTLRTLRLVVTLTTRPAAEPHGADLEMATLALTTSEGRELTRQVIFTGADAPAERGRTLAFVALSMLPDVAAPPPDVPAPPPDVPAADAPANAALQLAEPSRAHATAPAQSSAAATPSATRTLALEVRGVATLGLTDDGASTSFGGEVGFTWTPWSHIGLRAELAIRAGDLEVAQASTLWTAASVGVSFVALRARGTIDLDLELSLDAGLGRQSLSRYAPDERASATQAALAFVGRGGLALTWYPRPGFGVFAELGAEVVALRMPVYVADELRATLAPVRPTAGVGVRASL